MMELCFWSFSFPGLTQSLFCWKAFVKLQLKRISFLTLSSIPVESKMEGFILGNKSTPWKSLIVFEKKKIAHRFLGVWGRLTCTTRLGRESLLRAGPAIGGLNLSRLVHCKTNSLITVASWHYSAQILNLSISIMRNEIIVAWARYFMDLIFRFKMHNT